LAVYRNDQVEFSFGAEIGAGGYLAPMEADDEGVESDLDTDLNGVALPGDKVIGVTATTNIAVGNYVMIGANGTDSCEIRRVTAFDDSTTPKTLTLHAPVGYYHADAEIVQEIAYSAGSIATLTQDVKTMDHMRFTPGAWESIDVPDPTMEIEPRYFLGAGAKRNFNRAYKGQQSLSGTLSNFELLNGYPLRFPLGTVATTGSATGGSSTLSAATFAGQYEIDVASADTMAVGEYIQIGAGALAEVRKINAATSTNFFLDYPLLFGHDSGQAVAEVLSAGPFIHTILEAVELPGISWQVNNKDSSETATNDWIRRYFGGKIGQATLTAEEGGTLRMSWESAPFLNMNHNQYDDTVNVGVNKFDASNLAVTVEQPSTEPYYFSQGSISLFDVEFARVTNFTININNNLEPRYFINNSGERTPSAIYEGRREYSMTATIVLPDSISSTATTRTLFKELLAEGDYSAGFTGFDIDLVFTRGANDTITITIPDDGTSGTGGNNQGAFLRSANTSVSTDNPVSTEVDILFRNMKIVVVDAEPVYP